MQINPDARVSAIMQAYMTKPDTAGHVEALRQIDAQTVPAIMDTLRILPVTRQTMDRFVEFMEALDRKLAENGRPEFKDHPRLKAALSYFKKSSSGEATMRNEEGQSPMDLYATVRKDIWSSIS